MILDPGNLLLIGSILLFFSIIAGKASFRFGVPALLIFLAVGMLFGSGGVGSWLGFGGIQFSNLGAAQFIGTMALSIILFSGGMDTKTSEIRPVVGEGVVLATVGVALTMGITGGFIYWLTSIIPGIPSLSVAESMLMAAVMSSTDSASVFSILRAKKKGLKENLKPMLELESGSNDPMAYMLTILLIQVIMSGEMNLWDSILMFIMQMSIGAVAGYLLGRLATIIINNINIDNVSLYPVLLLSFIFFIFSFTDLIQGNGYLAVYIAGLVVGNRKLSHKRSISTFFGGFAWLFQIVMFLTLGLLVNPYELVPIAGIGLMVGVFMIIVARPLTVFACLLPFRKISFKARTYVSWVGLRGAVPIIFAIYPLIANVPNASMIFNVVFFITIISLLVQGTTVGYMAERLGLAEKEQREQEFGMELSDEIKSSMSEIMVTDQMLSHGAHLMDLTLPDNTLVVMVKRGDTYFVPKGKTQLLCEDKLLVISDNEEELRRTYKELGIDDDYYIQKNE